MYLLSSAYGLREGVEPLPDLAVRLRAFGPQVRVCASPELAAAVGCAAARVGAVRFRSVARVRSAVAPGRTPDSDRNRVEAVRFRSVARVRWTAAVAAGVLQAGVWR